MPLDIKKLEEEALIDGLLNLYQRSVAGVQYLSRIATEGNSTKHFDCLLKAQTELEDAIAIYKRIQELNPSLCSAPTVTN